MMSGMETTIDEVAALLDLANAYDERYLARV
jgi:hypothetical protein